MKINAQLDMDVVALETDDTVTCMVSFEAPMPLPADTRPAETIIVVLDRSGSMEGAPLTAAKQALHNLVDVMIPSDKFGLVVFDQHARVQVPVRCMKDHDRRVVHNLIAGVESGTTTDIAAGYVLGLREARRHKGKVGASVVVLSDGHANEGTSDPLVMAQLAERARARQLTTATIGIGEGYDDSLLESMAHGGGGNHRFAATADETIAVLSQEAGDLLAKVALNTTVRVQPSILGMIDGIGSLHDVPRWLETDVNGDPVVVLGVGDIYAGETRQLLIQFKVPGLPNLGAFQLANILVEFTAVPELEENEVQWPLTVGVVDALELGQHHPRPDVRVAALLAQSTSAKRDAVVALERDDALGAERSLASGARILEEGSSQLRNIPENLRHRVDEEREHIQSLRDQAQIRGIHYNRRRIREDVSMNSRGRADDVRRSRARQVDRENG
jgi:Ca-activated chloride channel family protein